MLTGRCSYWSSHSPLIDRASEFDLLIADLQIIVVHPCLAEQMDQIITRELNRFAFNLSAQCTRGESLGKEDMQGILGIGILFNDNRMIRSVRPGDGQFIFQDRIEHAVRREIDFTARTEKISVWTCGQFWHGQICQVVPVDVNDQVGRKVIVVSSVEQRRLIETSETKEKAFAGSMHVRLRIVIVGERQLIAHV